MANTPSSRETSAATREEKGMIASIARNLSRDLDDAARPSACPECLELCYASIRTLAVDKVRSDCHDLFKNCMRVITWHRTGDEIEVLRHRLGRASEVCSRKHLHGWQYRDQAVVPARDPLHLFIDTLYATINLALAFGSHAPVAVHENPKRVPGHNKNMWPTKATDLHPSGAYEAATAHVFWGSKLWTAETFKFMRNVIDVYRTTLVPYITRSPLRERLIWTLTCMLYTNIDRAVCNWPAPISVANTPSKDDAFWAFDVNLLHAADSRALSVGLVSNIFYAISHGMEGNIADLNEFVDGYEPVLIRAIISSLPTLKAGDMNKTYLARLAQELARNAGLPESSLPRSVLDLTEHLRSPAALSIIAEIIHRRFKSRDCYGPSCAMSVHNNTTGKPFQRCGRCKFVQYCSKECQLEDWKQAEVPHKELCPLLQKLFKVGTYCSHAEFEAEFQKSGIDLRDDCEPIYKWGLLHGDVENLNMVD